MIIVFLVLSKRRFLFSSTDVTFNETLIETLNAYLNARLNERPNEEGYHPCPKIKPQVWAL